VEKQTFIHRKSNWVSHMGRENSTTEKPNALPLKSPLRIYLEKALNHSLVNTKN
jgi:hypothetical protein